MNIESKSSCVKAVCVFLNRTALPQNLDKEKR